MSNRKNHNSIVFLATLGVYIGLVLVGSPTGLLANPAAMTRNFDLKDEVEITERLDNDPDDLFGDSIFDLVKNLDKLSNEQKFSWNPTTDVEYKNFNSTDANISRGFEYDGLFRATNERIRTAFGQKLKKNGISSLDAVIFDFKYRIEQKDLTLTFSVKTKTASAANMLGEAVNQYLLTVNRNIKTRGQQIVKENTTSTVDNTTVILASHLARGDVDELLSISN